jgi:hypothetical protein
MWNITELECNNLLQFLSNYEANSYSYKLVEAEQEIMPYTYAEEGYSKYYCLLLWIT